MKTAVVWGKCGPRHGVLVSVAEGLRKCGYAVQWRNPAGYRDGNDIPDSAVSVTLGARDKWGEILAGNSARSITTLVAEFGFLRRNGKVYNDREAYYSLCLGGIGAIAPTAPDDARLRALGYADLPSLRSEDGHVLVCLQVPNDAQHGLNTMQLSEWYSDTVADIKSATSRPIVCRPHPKAEWFTVGECDSIVSPFDRPLELDLRGAHSVVTYNSTSGVEAIAHGVPVYSAQPERFGGLYAIDPWNIESIEYDAELARDYLCRVSYSQWTLPELETAQPFEHLGVA